MSSTTADTWNNPQISPAVVGTHLRDISPSAAADYEARFPELPVVVDDSTKAAPTTSNTTTSTTATTESSLPHPTDSTPRAPPKKKRTRSTGVEDATPRPRPPVPVLPTTQYVSLQPPYYPPAPPLEPHQLDYHSAQAYCATPTYGSYSPPTQVLRPLPYPARMRDSYCGSSYAPPAHYPHPLPTPPPPPPAAVAAYMEREGGDCQRCETTTAAAGKGKGGKAKGAAEAEAGYIPPQDGDKKYVPPAYYSTTPPPSPTAVRVPTGYPFLAESLAGAPGLQVYRRFAKLNHLVLLHLQDEIAELEGVLEGLDAWEYGCAGGVGLRARRGMGTGCRRLQVMGAIAFKLQQYNKALKGYREMMDALDPLEEGDLEVYRAWMAERRPLVDVEGRVVGDHPEDLARLYRRPKIRNSEIKFSPALKMGLTVLSCGVVGVAGSLRVSRAADVPLALAAGAMGGAAAAMWAFF